MNYQKIEFDNGNGHVLRGRIEFPISKEPDAYAVFAHAFTGNKNLIASKYISRALMLNGIAVLRFDFTGLGDSDGDFSDTNFSSNVRDVVAACDFLTENYQAPEIIVGHSLGGAASIFAAAKVESVKAVATVGTPSEPEHVIHLLKAKIDVIENKGLAEVMIGGKKFTIKKHFLEDLSNKAMAETISTLDKAILILHSPQDRIVEIENAAKIYHAAHHPKSFITLNKADHMLMDKNDAYYVGQVIASWVKRYIHIPDKEVLKSHRSIVSMTGDDKSSTEIMAGKHGFIADCSESYGGNDFGPSPYELLAGSLGSSTSMTIYQYAMRHQISVEQVKVHLSFDSRYEEDFTDSEEVYKTIKGLIREIEIEGDITTHEMTRLMKVAEMCPIYQSLNHQNQITTSYI